MDGRGEREREAWRTYLVAQLPGWIIAVVVGGVLFRLTDLPAWAGLCLLLGWIGSGLLAYPRVKRYYTSDPAQRRIVGETGVTASALAPDGFVRVNGEIWQATAIEAAQPLREGTQVRVRDVRGLHLWVEAEDPSRPPHA